MVQFQEIQEMEEKLKNCDLQNTVVNVEEEPPGTALQEERRRTGKALATGIVIFLVGLGLYHAVVYGSSKLSALVGGFIIMLLYLVSLLYSWHRKKKLTKSNEAALERQIKEVIVNASKSAKKLQEEEKLRREGEKREPLERPRFIRTFSVG